MRMLLVLPLLLGAGGPEPAPHVADEALLKKANLPTDVDGLLQFFRRRTPTTEQRERLADLIAKLGAKEYATREKAAAALRKEGLVARPLLLEALSDRDKEVAQRAQLCLRQIDMNEERAQVGAAVRLLVHHKSPAAIEALLNYTPFASDETIHEHLRDALAVLIGKAPTLHAALKQALSDPLPIKRLIAGEALCKADAGAHKSILLPLLKDSDKLVRLHLALACVEARQIEGVPVLISLITELPVREVWRAEEMLARLAGEDAPPLLVDAKTPAEKVQKAWAGWWTRTEPLVDQGKQALTAKHHGFLVITEMGALKGKAAVSGRVYELDAKKEVRWEIGNLRSPVDARVVGPDRVLITENGGKRITERDFKGNVLWERLVNTPIAAQRLPNGNTFIATRTELLILDRDNKEVFTYAPQDTTITAAFCLRDGSTFHVADSRCIKLDPSGKEVRSFEVGQVYTRGGGGMDVLPGERVLIPEYYNNRVVEYDAEGKIRWQVEVQSPTSAMRLPNGHTLVTSLSNWQIMAFDRDGQQAWGIDASHQPARARAR